VFNITTVGEFDLEIKTGDNYSYIYYEGKVVASAKPDQMFSVSAGIQSVPVDLLAGFADVFNEANDLLIQAREIVVHEYIQQGAHLRESGWTAPIPALHRREYSIIDDRLKGIPTKGLLTYDPVANRTDYEYIDVTRKVWTKSLNEWKGREQLNQSRVWTQTEPDRNAILAEWINQTELLRYEVRVPVAQLSNGVYDFNPHYFAYAERVDGEWKTFNGVTGVWTPVKSDMVEGWRKVESIPRPIGYRAFNTSGNCWVKEDQIELCRTINGGRSPFTELRPWYGPSLIE